MKMLQTDDDSQTPREWGEPERFELVARVLAGEIDLDTAAAKYWISIADLEQWMIDYVIDARHRGGEEVPFGTTFWAQIADRPTTRLLELIEEHKQTCMLEVVGKGVKGRLWTLNGQVVDARTDFQDGLEAAVTLLELTKGSVGIRFDDREPERTIKRSDAVQVELARRKQRKKTLLRMLGKLDRVVKPVAGASQAELSDEHRKLLESIDGTKTLQHIIDHAKDAFATLEGLVYLNQGGYIERVTEDLPAVAPGNPGASGTPRLPETPKDGPSRMLVALGITFVLFGWLALTFCDVTGGDEDPANSARVEAP